MDRRTLLQLLSSGLAIAPAANGQSHCGASPSPEKKGTAAPYEFQFFSAEEAALVESVMEMIIPRDDHSPGARDARVIEFADLMIAARGEQEKQDWRIGTRLLAAELKNGSIDAWLESVSKNEANAQTVAEVFFRSLKQMTINGYYSSSTGIHEDLHYQGNTYVAKFEGCEHAEHIG